MMRLGETMWDETKWDEARRVKRRQDERRRDETRLDERNEMTEFKYWPPAHLLINVFLLINFNHIVLFMNHTNKLTHSDIVYVTHFYYWAALTHGFSYSFSSLTHSRVWPLLLTFIIDETGGPCQCRGFIPWPSSYFEINQPIRSRFQNTGALEWIVSRF